VSEILGIDHIQLAVPIGGEAACRAFYLGLLGLPEIELPAVATGRSFLWVRVGRQEMHFREDTEFRAAPLAHPGILVRDAEALAGRLTAAGHDVSRAQVVGPNRFHVRDPFGNRLEFIEASSAETSALAKELDHAS